MYVCYPGTDWAIDLHRCPMHYLTQDLGILFKLWDEYQAGRPIYGGAGFMDLPKRLVDAFTVLDHYMVEAAEKK